MVDHELRSALLQRSFDLVTVQDVEYKTFLKQLTWRSSVGVLLEGISSTSIVLNLALILCVSFVRFYNFLRHLRRYGHKPSSLLVGRCVTFSLSLCVAPGMEAASLTCG
jgi:hypothetical protein